MRKSLLYLKMFRIKQWTKNLLIFLPAFISPYEIGMQSFFVLIMTFGLFCCSASIIYIVNDWTDRELDAIHKNKKHRPFASKELTLQDALIGLLLLSVIFIYLCLEISKVSLGVSVLIIIYLIQSILYSYFLKNVTLVEMLIVSTGYSYRVLAGGLSINLLPSTWMLLTIFLASLFMIAQKRLSDKSCAESQNQLRASINAYPEAFLTSVTSISAAAAIISYILFTLSDYAQVKFQNPYLPISSIFIIYATFRYLQVAIASSKAHDPIQLIIQDRHLNACVFFCLLFIIITNSI
jgi:decaprenyl-phosphate phosphoribosyltransferase